MREYFEKIYKKGFNEFEKELESRIIEEKKSFIVTANPETLMLGSSNAELDKALKADDTVITPDGIGVVKAAQMLGYEVSGRVTGVEIVGSLLKILDREGKSLCLLGAKKEVLELLTDKIKNEYPNINLLFYKDGYIEDKDAAMQEMAALKPDAVLVALGIPAQELLIMKHLDSFDKGIFIGVGGSFDVISGSKKRAPKIFIKLNLEWLYRIVCEPSRIKRFYNSNIKFIAKIKEMRREK